MLIMPTTTTNFQALADGIVTEDLAVAGGRAYSTSEVGDYVAKNV